MKIKELAIANFKSFKELGRNDFNNLGDINMIFGYNNSGKSNVAKFLKLLFMKKYGGETVELSEDQTVRARFESGKMNFWEGQLINSPYLFHNNDTSEPITFEILFEETRENLPEGDSHLTELYEDLSNIEVKGEFIHVDHGVSRVVLTSVSLNGTNLCERDQSTVKYFPTVEMLKGNSSVFVEFLSTFNDAVELVDSDRYFEFESEDPIDSPLTPKNFKNWIHNLSLDPSRYDEFVKLIEALSRFNPNADGKPALEANLSNYPLSDIDLGFSRSNGGLDVMLSKKGRLPIESYGTGIQQIFYILAKIFTSDSKVLIIEELELNLSPEYQNELLSFLKEVIDSGEFDQFFFTSHSNFLVNHFMVSSFHSVSIDVNGLSSVQSLTHGAAREYFDNQFVRQEQQ